MKKKKSAVMPRLKLSANTPFLGMLKYNHFDGFRRGDELLSIAILSGPNRRLKAEVGEVNGEAGRGLFFSSSFDLESFFQWQLRTHTARAFCVGTTSIGV